MTVNQLLRETTPWEFVRWRAYFKLKDERETEAENVRQIEAAKQAQRERLEGSA